MKKTMRNIGLLIVVFLLSATVSVSALAHTDGGESVVFLPIIQNNHFGYNEGWDVEWHFHQDYGDPQDKLADKTTWETFADLPHGSLPYDSWMSMQGIEFTFTLPQDQYAIVATGNVIVDNKLNLEYQDEGSYLLVIRGEKDNFRRVKLSDYSGGIYNVVPSGPYVTLGFILQQIEAVGKAPNCDNGCRKATVVVLDLETNSYRVWDVPTSDSRFWQKAQLPDPRPEEPVPTLTPTPTSTQPKPPTLTMTPDPEPTSTPVPTKEAPGTPDEYLSGWNTAWMVWPGYGEPEDRLLDMTSWETLAGPSGEWASCEWQTIGVGSTKVTVPAGTLVFATTGSVTIDGGALVLPWQEGNNYLLIFRGLDPFKYSSSRDVYLCNAGGVLNILGKGAFVNIDWFLDQLINSGNEPNCGTGCDQVTVVFIDLMSNTYRMWSVDPTTSRSWTRVQ